MSEPRKDFHFKHTILWLMLSNLAHYDNDDLGEKHADEERWGGLAKCLMPRLSMWCHVSTLCGLVLESSGIICAESWCLTGQESEWWWCWGPFTHTSAWTRNRWKRRWVTTLVSGRYLPMCLISQRGRFSMYSLSVSSYHCEYIVLMYAQIVVWSLILAWAFMTNNSYNTKHIPLWVHD